MRGRIARRGNGYRLVLDAGKDPSTGKRRQHTETFRLKADAERRLAELLQSVNTGAYVKPVRLTMGEFLRQWLDSYADTHTSVRTSREYRRKIEADIIPQLGSVPLTDLRPDHLQGFYAECLANGRKRTTGGLSGRTVLQLHRIINEALKHGVRWGLIERNVALAVDPPRAEHREMAVLDAEGVALALETLEGTPWHLVVYMAVSTGMRRSELLALRWSDVDLTFASLSVVRTIHQLPGGEVVFARPKTAKSRRRVALAPMTVLQLRAHRERQEAERTTLGMAINQDDLVFAQHDGLPMHPDSLTGVWVNTARAIGRPEVRLHDLRHTSATLLLQQGIHPKVVSERLGHASVTITLDTYSHVLPGMQDEAASAIEDALAVGRIREQSINSRTGRA